MSLADRHPQQTLCSGNARDFANLSEVQSHIEAFLRGSLPIIVPNLHGWKPGKAARRNEKAIAAELCKDLNTESCNELFYFFPEAPQNEGATRTLDMEVLPRGTLNVTGRSLGDERPCTESRQSCCQLHTPAWRIGHGNMWSGVGRAKMSRTSPSKAASSASDKDCTARIWIVLP